MKKGLSWALVCALTLQAAVSTGVGSAYADAPVQITTGQNMSLQVSSQLATSPQVMTGQTMTAQIEDVQELKPYSGQVEVSKKPSLSIQLTESVRKGQDGGSVMIQSLSDNRKVKQFDMDTEVKIFDHKDGTEVPSGGYGTYITFDMGTDELSSGGYYVLIDNGAFVNEQDVPFEGIQDAGTWRFWTEGMGEVPVVEKTPAHNAAGVLPASSLALKFSKDMYPAAGSIEIIQRSNNQVVDTIPVTSSRVSGGGTSTIRITPTTALENNTVYDVVVPLGAFWDAYQNRSQPIAKGSWSFTVSTDTSALTVSSLSPSDGSMSAPVDQPLILTFNKTLNPEYTGSVTLRKAGGSTVGARTVINSSNPRQLVITPTAQLEHNTTYQVDVPGGVFRDAAGNTFAGLTGSRSWSFKTYTRDTTAPVLQSSKMYTNTLIRLTYNEVLGTNVKPLTSSYSVTVNGENRGISDVSVSGDTVYVMLDTGVAVGQVVRLSYTPGVRPVQDLSGNSAASFSNREIVNDLDSVLSKPREGTVYGNTLYLYFTESVKVTASNARDQFQVTANGNSIGVSSISISSGSAVTLILSRAVTDGEVVRVTYTPGSYPLKDYREQALPGFGDFFVRNSYDTRAPEFVETWAGGNKLYIQYNEALRTDNLPLKSQFSVLVNRSPLYVNSVEVNEDTVELTLANSLAMNQDVTLSYIPGVKRLTDLNYNPAGYLDLIPVMVYGSGSVKQGSVQSQTVTLTMSEAMQMQSSITPSQFTIIAGGQGVQVASASVQNQTVTITLTAPVYAGQNVTLAYSPGAIPLKSATGETITGFGPFALQNRTSSTTGGGSTSMPSGLTVLDSSLFNETGYVLNSIAAAKSSVMSKYNRSANAYTPSTELLKQAYTYINASGGTPLVAVEVPQTEGAAVVGFKLQALDEMKRLNSRAVIGVRYGDTLYTVPVSQLELNTMAGAANTTISGATLYIQLEAVTPSSSVAMDQLLGQSSASKLSSIMDASTYVSNDSSTYKTALASNGQLYLRLSGTVSSSTLGLVKMDNTIQRLSPVPFRMTKTRDAHIVQAKLAGNQAVVPANHSVSYVGMYSHWARTSIERLASMWIIDQPGGSNYEPDRPITRAEFAGMIARSLGLDGDFEESRRFGDVPYSISGAYIGAATKAGIITGHQDGTFKPDQLITREQMAIMMVRALHYGGHESALNGTPNSILSKFKDRVYIQAPNIVAEAVQQGIIEGMTHNTFKPGGQATRAQAAVMITRMLSIYTE
ncbi:SwmB domain-containing protein [Paenibacillus urinalis]|uniref:SwmB domain-containing protein n=1 Tax=Paenibacillus urinalis TaxID=521520 RepID=A0ABY7X846_9BACL|nr:SwmB domain-containing protein [Paenibacillus urinalis]WDH98297.1 SwmB domain-containing protein [Paenibacillus urinalis]WDI01984.1 SwmB domain-containing protein [Paenibacillus urinalis]